MVIFMDDAAVAVDGLVKTFGRQTVLNNINLRVVAGSYTGLIGSNGAGKTTLIKSILDFIAIDSGRISLFGVPHVCRRARSCLSFLPENFLPPYYLNGKDFLGYMAELYAREYSEADIRQMLRILDLDQGVLKKSVRQYSKGMTQKLGLAACLLSRRKMLIFDEPMSGLDPRARAQLKQYLIDLKASNITCFFSTHQLADIEALCDQIIILDEARVRFSGTPEECMNQYRSGDIEGAYLASISDHHPC